MKIKVSKLTGLFLLLILAIGNASLRLSEDGMTSFFRILSPVVVGVILLNRRKKLGKSFVCVMFGVIYSIAVSLMGYGSIAYEYIVFVLYIYAVFVIMVDIKESSDDFEYSFWKFLHITTTVVLILAFIQIFVRVPFPYVAMPRTPAVNLFMSNENELAEPLGFISLVYLYKILFENKKKYVFWLLAIDALLFVNDAKLTIIGCVVGYALLLYIKLQSKCKKFSPIAAFGIAGGGVVVVVLLLYIMNPEIAFRDYSISLKDLIFDAVEHIVTLEPMPGRGGSLIDRTNAIIYGLKELGNSNLLGIGLGHSVTMLSFPQYKLLTAKSMHNIVFQFLCEMGIFAFWAYFMIIKWVLKNIKHMYSNPHFVIKIVTIFSFIFISAQSSIGILSNYYTWMVLFYVAFLPDKRLQQQNSLQCKCRNDGG